MLFRGETNSLFLIPIGILSNVKYFLLIFPLIVLTRERFVTYPKMVVSIKVKSVVNDLASTKI